MRSDEALAAYKDWVQKFPEDREESRKSFKDRFGFDPEGERPLYGGSTGEVATKARARLATLESEKGAAEYQQEVANAQAEAVGKVASTIPVAATLGTAGVAWPLALGAMGVAGMAGGAYEEAAKLALGSEDVAQSGLQLGRRLGIDAALSAGTEGGGRLMGKLFQLAGEKVWEPLVGRAAARADTGKTILDAYGSRQMNQIRNFFSSVNRPTTTIHDELNTLHASIKLQETGTSEAFKDTWSNLAQRIEEWRNSGSTLSGLVELKGYAMQAAYKKEGLSRGERDALKLFERQLDSKLTNAFRRYGGEEGKKLYAEFKATKEEIEKFQAGLELSEKAVKRFGYRTAYGYALGAGGAGYGGYEGYQHGGFGGLMAGAAAGAIVGAGAETAFLAFERKMAPVLLQHILANKESAPMAKKAMELFIQGDTKAAMSAFARAISQSEAKDVLGPMMKDQAEKTYKALQEVPSAP